MTGPVERPAAPRFARALLARVLPQRERDFVVCDLDETFSALANDRGARHARRWYRWQVLRGLPSALEMRQASIASGVWLDLRHSLRAMRRSPGFTTIAVLVLGLGIGICTAAFTMVNAAFFKPLPVRAPNELVYVYQVFPKYGQVGVTSYRDVEYLAQHSATLSAVGSHWGRAVLFNADGETERIQGEHVSANYFDLLGVEPYLGRTFSPEEGELSSTQPAVVISHEWWHRRFREDRSVIGKRVRLDTKEFTIIGVAPPGFVGLADPWKPSRYWVLSSQYSGPEFVRYGTGVFGRIRPGLTFEQARAALLGELRQYDKEFFDRAHGAGYRGSDTPNARLVLPVASVRTPSDPRAEVVPARLLSAIVTVVAIVLLISVANIAGILMARGVARTPELAARRALGASAARLVRQLLTESVLLSFAGGLAGLVIAHIILGLYRAYTPERFVIDATLDMRVILFSAAACAITGLIVGLLPALQARGVDIVSSLGNGGGAGTTSRIRRRFRHGIVVPQVGLALVLLIVAGVHVRTLQTIEHDSLGYQVEDRVRLQTSSWNPADASTIRQSTQDEVARRAQRSRELYARLYEGVRDLPVEGIALTDRLPMSFSNPPPTWLSEDKYLAGSSDVEVATLTSVSPGYFRTIGMRLISGRDFDDRDVLNSVHTAVVSEGFAARLWPGVDPIGKRLAAYSPDSPDRKIEWLEVAGLVNEIDPILHDRGESPVVYVALGQRWQVGHLNVVAWARGDQAAAIQSVKRAVIGADTFLQVSDVQTLKEIVGEILYPRRSAAAILLVSGAVGLALACIGLYGVVSYSVAQRTREIGVRVALGADRRSIAGLVLREAATVTIVGALLGFGVSAFALRMTATLVGPVPTSDALVFVSVPLIVALVVLAACYLPARRAAESDPIEALRTS